MTSPCTQARSSDELVAALRGLPFHQWAAFRHRTGLAVDFDRVAARVLAEWNCEERRSQIRQALTAAATSCVQAMANLDGAPIVQHLAVAEQALRAAEALQSTGTSTSGSLGDR